MRNNKYSYQDCLNYACSLSKKNNINEIKNDLISLCQINSEKFWLSFSDKILTFSDYSKICYNFFRYFSENCPIPYLTNEVCFYGLSFYIEEGVLIPQKDTEILVDKTKSMAEKIWDLKENLKVLDIGTGCGNIAISLAKDKPNWNITAIDINEKALKVAKINAIEHELANIKFKKSDLFGELNSGEKFNIIVTNPPYISIDEYHNLSFVTKKQPFEALVAKNGGYYFYQEILWQARNYLESKFLLIMEIGYCQAEKVIKFIIEYFPKAEVSIFVDYQNNSRVIAVYQL